MLKRMRAAVSRCSVSIKLTVKCNKYLLLAVFVAGLLGFIFAASSVIGAENTGVTVNIYVLIQTETFSFFAFFLRLLIYYAVFAVLIFMSACHFYLLCVAFPCLVVTSYFYCKAMLFSVVFDGFAGIAMMLFYMLPIALFYLFTYFIALKDVYAFVGFDCNRKHFTHINFYKRPLFKCIFKMLLWNLIFDLTLTILIAIIAAIF